MALTRRGFLTLVGGTMAGTIGLRLPTRRTTFTADYHDFLVKVPDETVVDQMYVLITMHIDNPRRLGVITGIA